MLAHRITLHIDTKNYGNKFQKVVAIAADDISTKKGANSNWGVMDLGYCPGKACVILSFKVVPSSKSKRHFIQRMTVLAMHELGHTYGLSHCENFTCLMQDAEGKMNLDRAEKYCNACQLHLKTANVLAGH